jgi:crossover junction endodeoxyribonuclease RusA
MTEPLLELWVPGVPQPQGSKRIFGGRLVEGNDRTLRPYRASIAGNARATFGDREPARDVALDVTLGFMFERPKSHYGSGRNAHEIKRSAPAYKSTRPDLDKLVRAVLDALTGIVFVEDSQVARLSAWKDYGPAGVAIRVDFADVFSSRGIEGISSAA